MPDAESCSDRLRSDARRPEPKILKQHPLLPGKETQLEPAEDVVHDRLGKADVGIAGPAARLEACVGELFAEQLQRDAMLQRDRDVARAKLSISPETVEPSLAMVMNSSPGSPHRDTGRR
jgi:hypothetical protein